MAEQDLYANCWMLPFFCNIIIKNKTREAINSQSILLKFEVTILKQTLDNECAV